MKVIHTYCDACGRQMDWQSGSSQYVNGFEIEGELTISARVRNGGEDAASNSSWQAARFIPKHICSSACMKDAFVKLMEQTLKQKVPPLKEFAK